MCVTMFILFFVENLHLRIFMYTKQVYYEWSPILVEVQNSKMTNKINPAQGTHFNLRVCVCDLLVETYTYICVCLCTQAHSVCVKEYLLEKYRQFVWNDNYRREMIPVWQKPGERGERNSYCFNLEKMIVVEVKKRR